MDGTTSRYDTVLLDGQKVRERRKSVRLTQQRLAQAISRSRGWISIIEGSQRASVSRTTAQALAQTLEVDLDELLAPEADEATTSPSSSARDQSQLGDFVFGTPAPVSGTSRDDQAELRAILADLRRLEQRLEQLLKKPKRKR
jgi:transcriptional regulator with XRE-family HTH domain